MTTSLLGMENSWCTSSDFSFIFCTFCITGSENLRSPSGWGAPSFCCSCCRNVSELPGQFAPRSLFTHHCVAGKSGDSHSEMRREFSNPEFEKFPCKDPVKWIPLSQNRYPIRGQICDLSSKSPVETLILPKHILHPCEYTFALPRWWVNGCLRLLPFARRVLQDKLEYLLKQRTEDDHLAFTSFVRLHGLWPCEWFLTFAPFLHDLMK